MTREPLRWRSFLQRVGDRDRFVHVSLRDHFADHYDPS
jgi:hypothetical protein